MRILMDVDEGGQITVKSGTKLDFEDQDHLHGDADGRRTPSAKPPQSTVTIMVTDVDEAPEIMVGPATGLTVSGPASAELRGERDGACGHLHGLRAGCGLGYVDAGR